VRLKKAEDRELFKESPWSASACDLPRSGIAYSLEEAREVAEIGYPLIIRASFTLGGTGGGVAYNREEWRSGCPAGLECQHDLEI
jgi:carbamoyl-phosphate synthase large subunit